MIKNKKRIKKALKNSIAVDNEYFAHHILPAAPLDFVKRIAAIQFEEGLRCAAKEIAEQELKAREHEEREYIGAEPMDKYLAITTELKLSKKISAKDNTRWHEGKKAISYAIYDDNLEMVGVLMVKPRILREAEGRG